jgi:uncharacterized protein (TIGR02599 family)
MTPSPNADFALAAPQTPASPFKAPFSPEPSASGTLWDPATARKLHGSVAPDSTVTGFTIIELMSSIAILSVLIVVLVSMVSHTTLIWRYTTGKIEQFRDAREGYESMTRHLAQATLNTYWDYDDPLKPTKYVRQAELRFLSGRGIAQDLTGKTVRPTHAVFFFAPLGYVENPKATNNTNPYRGLDYLLNTWGYYIDYNNDKALKPPFVNSPDRNRFRLMETMVPSQDVNIYNVINDPGQYQSHGWIFGKSGGTGFSNLNSHVLAENIIALVILPKPSKADIDKWNSSGGAKYDETSLVGKTSYTYDTCSPPASRMADPRLNPKNQLPPVVQVSMVAIDEASAIRMTDTDNQDLLQKLGQLFQAPPKLNSDLIGDPPDPKTESLTEYLVRKHINYRVFTSDVGIRGAKWSTETTN